MLPILDDDFDSLFLTTNLAIPVATNTVVTSSMEPNTELFDLDKFLSTLNDEQTYYNPDGSMSQTDNPCIQKLETGIQSYQYSADTSQPSVETSQPAVETSQTFVETSQTFVEVPSPTCEVFVPEVNMSFTDPVLQTVPITDRTSPHMKVMTRYTGLNTTMKAKKSNNERCKAYRLRKKMETEQMMKDLEDLTRRNEELKLIAQCKQKQLNAYMKLLIKMKT